LKQPLYSTDAKNELVRSIFEAHSDLNDWISNFFIKILFLNTMLLMKQTLHFL